MKGSAGYGYGYGWMCDRRRRCDTVRCGPIRPNRECLERRLSVSVWCVFKSVSLWIYGDCDMYWKATTVKVGSLCVFLCVRVTRGFGLARVQARLSVVMRHDHIDRALGSSVHLLIILYHPIHTPHTQALSELTDTNLSHTSSLS